jgi:hypothetical protein
MPIPLTGITGYNPVGGSTAANRGARKTDLQNKIAQDANLDAKGTLIALRGHLEGAPRNGFLRLDGSGSGGDVSFSTHSWKGWGKSAKGEVTGEALRALFAKAGYSTEHLDRYLGKPGEAGYRGNQRVQLANLREIMRETGIPMPAANAGQAPGNASVDNRGEINTDPQKVAIPWTSPKEADLVPLGKPGGFGAAYRVTVDGKEMALKLNNGIGDARTPPLALAGRNEGQPKIVRNVEATAAFMKDDQPGTIRPEYFIVRDMKTNQETLVRNARLDDGNGEGSTVSTFKEWTKDQLWDPATRQPRLNAPELKIVGQIMPIAEGNNLLSGVEPGSEGRVASSLMNTLLKYAEHGNIHGDLKPENVMFTVDPDTNAVSTKCIDTGGMAKLHDDKKLSLKEKDTRNDLFTFDRGITLGYSHPMALLGGRGMEQDLFSYGVMMLEMRSNNLGDNDATNAIINGVQNTTKSNPTPEDLEELYKDIKDDVYENQNDSFIQFGLKCIETALAPGGEWGKVITNREGWRRELNQLKSKIPQD